MFVFVEYNEGNWFSEDLACKVMWWSLGRG